MGTLWRTGNRTLAIHFLREHPSENSLAANSSGRGYRSGISRSASKQHFCTLPGGDRHFDTFRLYESLQAGCIPGRGTRWPRFASWGHNFRYRFENWKHNKFARELQNRRALNTLQMQCQQWWGATDSTYPRRLGKDKIRNKFLDRTPRPRQSDPTWHCYAVSKNANTNNDNLNF